MILSFMKKYKKESILAPLFKMLEAAFELFVPMVIAYVIDKGIGRSDKSVIMYGALLLLVLAIIGLTCSVRAQYHAAKAAMGLAADIRRELMVKIQSLSFARLENIGTDTMITRLTSDVNQIQNAVNMTLRLFSRSPFIVFGAVIMAFTIDKKCALIFAVMVVLLTIVVYGIMVITMPLYKKAQGGLDEILSITRENLTGVRVIRAFSMEEDEKEKFFDKNRALNRMQKSVGKLSALTNPLTFVIVNCATLVLLYTGALRVFEGILTAGQVVALTNYMSQILVELIKLANLIVLITRGMACADRIKAVLNMPSDEMETLDDYLSRPFGEKDAPDEDLEDIYPEDDKPVVEFKYVGFSYEDGGEALSDISFSARKGETVGVIGGTGSGKTTLVNLIPGFYFAKQGEVMLQGKDVRDYNLGALRKKVGVAFQKSMLFSGTIEENLLIANEDATEEELISALKTAQAWDFVSQRKKGLKEVIHQGGRDLSGGQKQRLNIARALVGKPDVIILDDSSSALDFATDAALRRSIREVVTDDYEPVVFIVSQRTSSVRNADRIIVLEDGKMVGLGTHDELLNTCSQYREIHESQQG